MLQNIRVAIWMQMCDQEGNWKTPDVRVKRIILGLRSMLLRFTMTEDMYVKLAGTIVHDYKTNKERVQAVRRVISNWKQDGLLNLRFPCRGQHRRTAPKAMLLAPESTTARARMR
ncbi:hypothetical protein AAMO2058_001652500 [Amorphochlora amoebiformis]